MTHVIASAPGKVILFGEHGVNRHQSALSTAVELRTYCRVSRADDNTYALRFNEHQERGDHSRLMAFKEKISNLREAGNLDQIRQAAQDFFAPTRYVLAHVMKKIGKIGVDIEWASSLPIASGMGSGAAASTAMIRALYALEGMAIDPADLIDLAWQGDIIAHGGVASSLDSSTCVYGGVISYSVADGAELLPHQMSISLVIGDTQIIAATAEINTRVRTWLEDHPARLHLFKDVGFLVREAIQALAVRDLAKLAHLMNLHQLFQEKIGTSCPEIEQLIEASIAAGASAAKISGSGGGGIIIALAEPEQQASVAAAIEDAGGRSFVVSTGAEGVRVEKHISWETLTR